MLTGGLVLSFSHARPGVGRYHRARFFQHLAAAFIFLTPLTLAAQDRPDRKTGADRTKSGTGQAQSRKASARKSPRRVMRDLEYDDASIDPDRAALYGIFPGGGQWYLGQEGTAFLQAGLFLSAEYLRREGIARKDYISPEERRVTFSPEQFLIARELDKNGLLYQDKTIPPGVGGTLLLYAAHQQGLANPLIPNLIGESKTERLARMLGLGPAGSAGTQATALEINPLVTYNGEYFRTNRTTIETDTFGDLTHWTLFYSIFSADRDARAFRDGLEPAEDLMALSSAPFQTEVVKNPWIWLPVVATPLLLELEKNQGKSVDPLTARPYNLLVSPGTLNDPSVQSTMIARSLGNALAEEALFRGVAQRRLSASYGFAAGSILSSSLYAAYQYGRGNENFWPQFAYGMYWSYLEYRGDSDLRLPVASHFWTNMAILLYSLSSARTDARAGKSSQEIHFMPVFFTFDA